MARLKIGDQIKLLKINATHVMNHTITITVINPEAPLPQGHLRFVELVKTIQESGGDPAKFLAFDNFAALSPTAYAEIICANNLAVALQHAAALADIKVTYANQ